MRVRFVVVVVAAQSSGSPDRQKGLDVQPESRDRQSHLRRAGAAVAKGDVPGAWYSPTQPFPLKPAALAKTDYKPSCTEAGER